MNEQCKGSRLSRTIRTLGAVAAIAQLIACSSPPTPPEPAGQWVPVNQPAAQLGRAEPK